MSEQSIFNAMPILATALCEKYGVRVTVCGHEAFTNGTQIVLPTTLNVPITSEELNGFLVHECSHVKFTDFSCGFFEKLPQVILNILEDGRIERKMCETVPGARYYLKKVEQKLASGEVADAAGVKDLQPTDEPHHVLLETCYLWARVKMAGFTDEFGPRMPAAEAACKAVFGEKMTRRFFNLLGEAEKAESTADVKKVVNRILSLLKRTVKNGRPQQQPQQPQPQQAGMSGQSGQLGQFGQLQDPKQSQQTQQQPDQGDGASSDAAGAADQGDPSSSSGDSKDDGQSSDDQSDGQSDAQSDDQAGGQSDAQSDDQADDQADAQSDASATDQNTEAKKQDGKQGKSKSSKKGKSSNSGASAEDAGRNASAVLAANYATLVQESEKYSPQEEVKRKLNEASYKDGINDCCWTSVPAGQQGALNDCLNLSNIFIPEDWAQVNRIVPRLSRRIRSAVEARDRTKRLRAESGRTVTLDGLVRYIGGDPRVFERRLEGKAVNTAIHLLIDDSGSMLGERMNGAQIAAVSLMKVLAGLKGINLGVSVFPGYDDRAAVSILPHGEGFRGAKIEEAIQNVIKVYPWGGTPIVEALLEVTKELKRCTRCTRHILYILTDGEIDTEVAPLLSRIKAAGIETRALLIAGRSCGFDVEVHLKKSAEADKIAASLIEMVTADVVA